MGMFFQTDKRVPGRRAGGGMRRDRRVRAMVNGEPATGGWDTIRPAGARMGDQSTRVQSPAMRGFDRIRTKTVAAPSER